MQATEMIIQKMLLTSLLSLCRKRIMKGLQPLLSVQARGLALACGHRLVPQEYKAVGPRFAERKPCGGSGQGDQRNLWRAAEAKGNAYSTNSPGHVELHITEGEQPFHILHAERRQVHRGHERYPDLAAMSMARQHEVDARTDDLVGVVGFVRHQNKRLGARHSTFWYGSADVGATSHENIRDASQP